MVFLSLEMQGFKSFPDKTKITFDKGVTAIIGPNGSGKSNISDAIRWVLGEMSVKSLRGSKMEDVLFSGTPTRSQANSAHVTINFLTEENEELSVTRRYYRTGESEYYLNQKQVRLKDVYERFYDTGIGREGYSVIGQGKISEILSQKGDERRSVFEEAAGISKYRYKKIESERKLEATENNLVRINDIMTEVSSRLVPLEKEAENAKKFLALSEEKKNLEITLWLDRIDKLKVDIESLRKVFEEESNELTKTEEQCAQIETEIDDILHQGYESARLVAESRQRSYNIGYEIKDTKNEIELIKNNCSHATDRISALDEEIKRIKGQLDEAEEGKKRLTDALEQSKLRLKEKSAKFKEATEKADGEKQGVWKLREEISNTNQSINEESQKLSEYLVAKTKLLSNLENISQNSSEAKERLNASVERYNNLLKIANNASEKAEELRNKYDVAARDLASTKIKIDKAKENIVSKEREISKIDIEIDSLTEKKEYLERMERLLEGYSGSVKAILQAPKDELNVKTHGIVSSVISVDEKYVVAIETALAASAQFIIVDDENDAKKCINYLKRTKGGRATFLPLSIIEGQSCNTKEIEALDGYVGVASDLCVYDKKYSCVVKDLLGKTVIAEDIDRASEIAKKSGFKIKIVTLDGQVIHPGGSYTGGSSAKKAGVLTRAMDIEKLEKEIKSKKSQRETEEEILAQLNTKLNEEEAENGKNLKKHEEISEEYRKALEIKSSELTRAEEEKSRLSDIKAQLEGHNKATEEIKQLLIDAEKECAFVEKSIESLKNLLSEQNEKLSVKEKEEGLSAETASKLNAALIEETASANALIEKLSESEQNCLNLSSNITEKQSEKATALSMLDGSDKHIDELKEKIEQLKLKKEEEENLAKEICDKQTENEHKIGELREKLKVVSAGKDVLIKNVTRHENRLTSITEEYDGIINSLWDEYELTYSTAEPYRISTDDIKKPSARLSYLKGAIKSLGVINVNAVEEYRTTKERYDFLSEQVNDLNKTRKSLDDAIAKLEESMTETFLACFVKINEAFGTVFSELFGGGTAACVLQDPEHPLESGIDITIRPPGKSVKSISLLSGGEQSFAAMALYLSLQAINPAPFCIFDEIESALDEINVVKFAEYIKRHSTSTQYIVITHRRGTMERADTVYGILMPQKGISDYIKLNLNTAKQDAKKYGIKSE
ncbi:MAG: chromosome segregation protein SMC [Ruminococcaceae bacterium]|nr:chromosome segregation protein SMC [Oscillospiraceae bacterium]